MYKTYYFHSFHSSLEDTYNNENYFLKKESLRLVYRWIHILNSGFEMFLKDNFILWLYHNKKFCF